LELALMLECELEPVLVRVRVLALTPEYQLRPVSVRVRVLGITMVLALELREEAYDLEASSELARERSLLLVGSQSLKSSQSVENGSAFVSAPSASVLTSSEKTVSMNTMYVGRIKKRIYLLFVLWLRVAGAHIRGT
jgi:hypothetical protein